MLQRIMGPRQGRMPWPARTRGVRERFGGGGGHGLGSQRQADGKSGGEGLLSRLFQRQPHFSSWTMLSVGLHVAGADASTFQGLANPANNQFFPKQYATSIKYCSASLVQ